MSFELKSGPTSLERLQTAIDRMVQKHGFTAVDRDLPQFPGGLSVVLLTDDPQRNLEVLDACVILPEALKALGQEVACQVAGPEVAAGLMKAWGVARAPSVVFLRDGEYAGALNGIRNWTEYRDEVARLLSGPAQPKPIGIPVRVESAQGAC
ncbi:MAG: hypothetical protein L6Q40_00830 [Azonexus sp.]|nr:hypothetical protein [Azonexus sp.]